MGNYLDVIYFRDEYSEDAYPQKLCDHIIANYLDQPNEGKKLLDIGSGKGNHLVAFGRRGIECTGMDLRKECIEALENFEIRECNIEQDPFPFDDNTFDYVFSKSVLEHVSNADNFLSQAYRVLKPGGKAVFLTPDWRSQCKFFWDDYTHVKAYTRKSLQNAMLMHKFENVDVSYFLQLPVLWKNPWMYPLIRLIALLPDRFKWKDKEESQFRPLIRFSKEEMLLGVGEKK